MWVYVWFKKQRHLNDRSTLIKRHAEWTTSIAMSIKDMQVTCFLTLGKNYLNTMFFSPDVQEKILLKAQLSTFLSVLTAFINKTTWKIFFIISIRPLNYLNSILYWRFPRLLTQVTFTFICLAAAMYNWPEVSATGMTMITRSVYSLRRINLSSTMIFTTTHYIKQCKVSFIHIYLTVQKRYWAEKSSCLHRQAFAIH